ncbi:MAG: hypothetical protein AVDCRST_MAG85-1333, partial [uncultured Solirubrobacteraceae bacterium]
MDARKSWRGCRTGLTAVVAAVLLAGGAGTVAVAEDLGLVSVDDAVEALMDANPAAVDETPVDGERVVPAVEQTADGFVADAKSTDVEIGDEPTDPITLETRAGDLDITQQNVAPLASDGEAVGDSAVVYANTGKDADTAVKPTEGGVETFTGIRSEDAAEDFSFEVDLAGEETLVEMPDGGVAIVDADPDPAAKAEAGPKPADVPAGSEQADELKEKAGVDAVDPDPKAEAEAEAAVEETGVKRPEGAEGAAAVDARPDETVKPDDAATAPGAPVPTLEDAPTAEELAEKAAKVEQQVEDTAEATLESAQDSAQAADAAVEKANAAQAAEQPVVVAEFHPPTSQDADGDPVETTLEVEGDTVTMHVDHRGEDVAYPIAADPWVTVVKTRWVWKARPVYRTETYLSHWEQSSFYVGHWHPAWCWWGVHCTDAGWGWWRNYYNWNTYLTYWPSWDWGPSYQLYWRPVYRQRSVVSHWVWYQAAENYLENVYVAGPEDQGPFGTEHLALDLGQVDKIGSAADEGPDLDASAAAYDNRGCRRTHDVRNLRAAGT